MDETEMLVQKYLSGKATDVEKDRLLDLTMKALNAIKIRLIRAKNEWAQLEYDLHEVKQNGR